jgi:hypothetical protein
VSGIVTQREVSILQAVALQRQLGVAIIPAHNRKLMTDLTNPQPVAAAVS